ncbi:MAG TPA: septal ring lytic transglycosylase RlpA family protein [Polyangiaceae bacterium]|nr:septal ring lytic transglycosylase RlpA family protein [Polyangiaceae bacterium]
MHETVKDTRRSCFVIGFLMACAACGSESRVRVDQPASRVGAKSTRNTTSAGCSDEDLGRHARQVLRGYASYYHDSLAGNATASGAPYDPELLSAAHRTLPFGTRIKVTRTDITAAPVCVTVNDRGPFRGRKRIVDLSRRAAEALGMMGKGVVPVRVDVF